MTQRPGSNKLNARAREILRRETFYGRTELDSRAEWHVVFGADQMYINTLMRAEKGRNLARPTTKDPRLPGESFARILSFVFASRASWRWSSVHRRRSPPFGNAARRMVHTYKVYRTQKRRRTTRAYFILCCHGTRWAKGFRGDVGDALAKSETARRLACETGGRAPDFGRYAISGGTLCFRSVLFFFLLFLRLLLVLVLRREGPPQ